LGVTKREGGKKGNTKSRGPGAQPPRGGNNKWFLGGFVGCLGG